MKRWIKIFEKFFVAVTYAEMGEYHKSLEIMGIHSISSSVLWNDGYVSVTFADAG